MKKLSIAFSLLIALVALTCFTPKSDASSSYYTSNCQGCHGTTVTCNGCHAHGTHASSAKNTNNVTGVTNKATYAPGETVTVTINGGYRTGWVRALLYDQNMKELARSTGPTGEGGGAGFPITLTAPAPTTAGTYTWDVAWYGNQSDAGSASFGVRWTTDPINPNHGQEIVSIAAFTVTAPPVAQPKITLAPAALDFGTITADTAATRTAQIANTGTADLTVTSIDRCAQTGMEYTWSTPTATPITVPAGGNVTLTIAYAPTAAGTDLGCLSISSNDPATPATPLNLTGIASAPPVGQPNLTLTPASLDFGAVLAGSSATKTARIANTGTVDLIITAIGRCTQTSAEFTSSPTTTPITVPAGGSTTLSVTYKPADAGTDTGCLNISSDDPATPTTAVNLTGTGSAPGTAADFDIVKFAAKQGGDGDNEAGNFVRFRLSVVNTGTTAGSAPAKLVGMKGAVEVYNQTITVSAPAGERATFIFPPYSPTARGTITWTVTVTDPAPDTATARTKARKGRHEDDRERED